MERLPVGALIFGIFALAQVGTLGIGPAAAVLGALVCGNLIVVRRRAEIRQGAGLGNESLAGPLAACWLAVTILPLHGFIRRSTTVAVSEVGIEPLLELTYFLVVAAFAATIIGRFQPGLRLARPPVALLALPVWVMASSAWGAPGPYAFARGLQMACVAALAWASMAAASGGGAFLDQLIGIYLRWLVRIAVGLVALGVVLGPINVPRGPQNADRFTWMGAHPNASGLILALALVTAVAAPTTLLRLRPAVRAGAVLIMAVALYANHSRMSWLELVSGSVVAVLLAGRLRPLLRWIGTPLLAMVGYAAVAYWGEQIGEYLLRNDDSESLASGNGRLGLWSVGFRALSTPFDWVCGRGYGVTRTLFLSEGDWAVNAHNSVLAWLVSGGLVAVALFLVIGAWTARNLVRVRPIATRGDGLALVGFTLVLAMNALASDGMAEPSMGFGGLYFAAAVAASLVVQHRGRAPAPVRL